jgi:hypothetical protein
MFLLRSAFWLTAAYLVMVPGQAEKIDLAAAGQALAGSAVRVGQQALAHQLGDPQCQTMECRGGQAMLSAVAPKPVHSPMRDSAAVPYPMPRPSWRS